MNNIVVKFFEYNGKITHYLVLSNGNVYDTNNKKYLKFIKNNSGYLYTSINIDNKFVRLAVHRIVAITFIPNPENKPQVNHKNGIKTDNRVENLEWMSISENHKHAYETGLHKPLSYKKVHFTKYDDTLIKQACIEIRKEILPLTEISKLLNIPQKVLSYIRKQKNWVEISSKIFDYNDPAYSIKNKLKYNTLRHIKELIKKDYSNKKICKELRIDKSDFNYDVINYRRKIIELEKEYEQLGISELPTCEKMEEEFLYKFEIEK